MESSETEVSGENAKVVDMYERLFAEEGWKDLIKDLSERIETYKNTLILNPSGERDLYYVKGFIAACRYIIELENMMETAKNEGLLEATQELPDL